MNVSLALALLALTVFSCSAGDTTPAAPRPAAEAGQGMFKSGARLRAVYINLGDTNVFDHWFDTKLGEACAFQVAEDGATRCLPGVTGYRFFADGSCGNMVLRPNVGPPCGEPKYMFVRDPPLSPGKCRNVDFHGYSVYRVGAARPPTLVNAQGSDGACRPIGAIDSLYSTGERVAAETFVAAERSVVSASDGLGSVVLTAEDGAQLTTGAEDLARSSGCHARDLGGGKLLCLPDDNHEVGSEGVFADSACAIPAVEQYSCGVGQTVLFKRELATDMCTPTDTISVLTPVPVAGQVYQMSGEQCSPAPGVAGSYMSLAPADSSTLPPMARSMRGTGEVLVGRLETNSGVGVYLGGFFTRDGQTCLPMPFADGKTRCVPGSLTFTHPPTYTNATCTQAMYQEATYGNCVTSAPPIIAEWEGSACKVRQLYAVGPVAAAPPFTYQLDSDEGGCRPAGQPGPEAFHSVRPLPSSTFPELHLVTE